MRHAKLRGTNRIEKPGRDSHAEIGNGTEIFWGGGWNLLVTLRTVHLHDKSKLVLYLETTTMRALITNGGETGGSSAAEFN